VHRHILNIFFVLFLPLSGEISPVEYFGSTWIEAQNFCSKNEPSIIEAFNKYNIDSNIGLSIVFPEILRYNRFKDAIETSALELAYVNWGKEYADFSIGYFQMKPSFIEKLEIELIKSDTDLQKEFNEITDFEECVDEMIARKTRIDRLIQMDWQLKYLCCFIKIATNKYSPSSLASHKDKLLLLANAYNTGLQASNDELIQASKRKTFPYGKYAPGRFSYSDISIFYYNSIDNKNKTLNHETN